MKMHAPTQLFPVSLQLQFPMLIWIKRQDKIYDAVKRLKSWSNNMIFMFFERVTCKFIKEKAGRNKQKNNNMPHYPDQNRIQVTVP